MANDKVFLDSSVLIAAVLSSRGGSFYILTSLKDTYEFKINEYVLEETSRVLDVKFASAPGLKSRLFLLLGTAEIKILQDPSPAALRLLAKIINPEDAPILASALRESRYLITLDEDFLVDQVRNFAKRQHLAVVRPREFLERHRSA